MAGLLFIYETNMPTVQILQDMFLDIADETGMKVGFSQVKQLTNDTMMQYSNIVFIRPTDYLSLALAKKARKAGKKVIVSIDDDLLAHRPLAPWRARYLKQILSCADYLFSSSSYLGEAYVKLTKGKKFIRLDTIVAEDQIFAPKPSDASCVRIVYAAHPGHKVMFDEIVYPVLEELIREIGAGFGFTFIGVHPDLKGIEKLVKVEYVEGMPFHEYRAYMKDHPFDIGLAPLYDTSFTRCKYINKYLEYSMHGIAGIYSNVIPYSDAVRNQENGFLADNTTDSWLNTLRIAITNVELRQKCIQNAQRDLRERFSKKVIIERLRTNLPELFDKETADVKIGSLQWSRRVYSALRILDLGYLSVYYLFNGGIQELSGRIRKHVKRHA